jgi:hypothetical protein
MQSNASSFQKSLDVFKNSNQTKQRTPSNKLKSESNNVMSPYKVKKVQVKTERSSK